jgi:hypothetical protein
VASTKYAKIGGHTETHFAIAGRRELLVWKKKRITAYCDFVSRNSNTGQKLKIE